MVKELIVGDAMHVLATTRPEAKKTISLILFRI